MIKKKYWFRPKKYWYGITPISLAGWLTTILFVFFVLLIFYSHDFFLIQGPDKKEILQGVVEVFLAVWVFSHYFEKKTQWELKWRWGTKK